ncbi:hypothetical protein C8R43DRAFT_949330 [Mycena crocata]|nr:hypothetical protein C8R43DRAFT_949330 [Mycena crocata]
MQKVKCNSLVQGIFHERPTVREQRRMHCAMLTLPWRIFQPMQYHGVRKNKQTDTSIIYERTWVKLPCGIKLRADSGELDVQCCHLLVLCHRLGQYLRGGILVRCKNWEFGMHAQPGNISSLASILWRTNRLRPRHDSLQIWFESGYIALKMVCERRKDGHFIAPSNLEFVLGVLGWVYSFTYLVGDCCEEHQQSFPSSDSFEIPVGNSVPVSYLDPWTRTHYKIAFSRRLGSTHRRRENGLALLPISVFLVARGRLSVEVQRLPHPAGTTVHSSNLRCHCRSHSLPSMSTSASASVLRPANPPAQSTSLDADNYELDLLDADVQAFWREALLDNPPPRRIRRWSLPDPNKLSWLVVTTHKLHSADDALPEPPLPPRHMSDFDDLKLRVAHLSPPPQISISSPITSPRRGVQVTRWRILNMLFIIKGRVPLQRPWTGYSEYFGPPCCVAFGVAFLAILWVPIRVMLTMQRDTIIHPWLPIIGSADVQKIEVCHKPNILNCREVHFAQTRHGIVRTNLEQRRHRTLWVFGLCGHLPDMPQCHVNIESPHGQHVTFVAYFWPVPPRFHFTSTCGQRFRRGLTANIQVASSGVQCSP